MSFEKFKDIDLISNLNQINDELFLAKKRLTDLTFEKKKNLLAKPHLFIHLKRRIAHLNFKKSLIVNNKVWQKNSKSEL